MGYEQERFVESFSPDLICCICLCVLEDPVECKTCQTNFCSGCIQQIADAGKLCPNHCPLQLQKSHRFLRSTLDNLSLKCIYTSFGCDQVIKVEKIKAHESSECQFRQQKCRYEDCTVVLTLKEVEEHETNCKYKTLHCPDCHEAIFSNMSSTHSCFNLLKDKVEVLSERLESICKVLEVIKKVTKNKLMDANLQVHHGVKCNGCEMFPIEGVRNVCKECLDYNLCWMCYRTVHEEHSFVQLLTREKHKGVTCDGCYESPIDGVRYKCTVCEDFGKGYADFCHKCKLTAPHPQHSFSVFVPYSIQVVPIKPSQVSYKNGDKLIRQWEVFNNSCDKISDMMMICTGGDSCIKNYKIEFPGVVIQPLSFGILTLKDVVFQPIPAAYTAEFQLCTSTRISFFGPVFKYSLVVLPNNSILSKNN